MVVLAGIDVRAGLTHGAGDDVDLAVWLGDDQDLALVNADPHAWAEAHPCECEALCECDL